MFDIVTKSIEWGGATLEFETGKVARQADGAVMVTYGETKVLCVATAAKQPMEGVDFFPLTVIYQEKTFAAGKIPGGFFKREAKPSEHETLTSRLIDRPIRPLFPEGFKNDTQVICTVLTHDMEHQPDIVALIGASAALAISGIPFAGPIAGARVGYVDGEYVLNPNVGFEEDSRLDLIVAGTESSVMMVESEADELSEDEMLGAVSFAHEQMQPVIKLINELKDAAGKAQWETAKEDNSALASRIKDLAEAGLRAAYEEQVKQDRTAKVAAAKDAALEQLAQEQGEEFNKEKAKAQLKKLEQEIVRGGLMSTKKRIDGRAPDQIRPIVSEAGILPRTHGSALFTRGETQALVVATLGTGDDEQRMDGLEGDRFEHFLLHYNFPPYSVGETGRMGPPGRREIGHGKLAWRALKALMPSKADFPYTVRLVSEITESNGSSSMATVCGGSLAMMDAGVPLKRAVAGIAMGLILEGSDFVVLSDIMGDEDHLGDMDFKVAGTTEGITSLQMDIKVQGITTEIMSQALRQANGGRMHILGEMGKALEASRGSVNEHAPKITSINIPVDKIREVIGSGGKVIREICEVSGAKVDIEDDGTIRIAAVNSESGDKALAMISDIVAEPEVGTVYNDCEVKSVVDFGAFVEFLGKNQGLVHVSEMSEERVESPSDFIQEGAKVHVKLLDIERGGKFRLSMRVVDQETGQEIEGAEIRNFPRGGKGGDKGDKRPPRRKSS